VKRIQYSLASSSITALEKDKGQSKRKGNEVMEGLNSRLENPAQATAKKGKLSRASHILLQFAKSANAIILQ